MFSISWKSLTRTHIVVGDENSVRMLYAVLISYEARQPRHISSIRVFDASNGAELDPENNWDPKGKEKPLDATK